MLANKMKTLILGVAAALALSACSTPCDSPGGLCAPISSVASPPAPERTRLPDRPPEPPTEEAQVFAVAMPPATTGDEATPPASGQPVRIGLMLPLRSETLGQAADALRAGFMAAWERDKAGFEVSVIETGDASDEVLPTYQSALGANDIVVGPLARSAVTALAGSTLVTKPTIALNRPEGREDAVLPPNMLSIGLSIEDEARQVAEWAAKDYPGGEALILSAGNTWQRRIASAFAAHWQQLGHTSKTLELATNNGYLSDAELVALRARLGSEPVELLFAALDADQARQLRTALNAPPLGDILQEGGELNGVRLLDLPWQVQRDSSAVMSYPRPEPRDEVRLAADMERLYALGIDAFRVARELALKPGQPVTLDGVTGQLNIEFGNGPAKFRRVEPAAVYRNGVAVPLPTQ